MKVSELVFKVRHGCPVKIINFDDDRDYTAFVRGLNHHEALGRFAHFEVVSVDVTRDTLEIECEMPE